MKAHRANDGMVLIWCPGCDEAHVFDTRWTFSGDLAKPTFSPSLLVEKKDPSKRCHSFVRDGKIQFLSDSHHTLAGQTVDLPEWE